jgi:hypothetical protein
MWVSNVRRRVAEAGCTRREGNFGLGRPLRCCRHYESKSRLGHGAPSARGTGRLPPLGHVGRSAHNFQVPHQAPVDRDFVRPWVVWATTTGDAGGGSATAALALMSWLSVAMEQLFLIRFGTARRRSTDAWIRCHPGRWNTYPDGRKRTPRFLRSCIRWRWAGQEQPSCISLYSGPPSARF